MSAVAALLPDGRLHLQHGPIDCLCRAWGEPHEIHAAYAQASRFFATVLDNLCDELPLLRTALPSRVPSGRIASAMHAACLPFADRFITPMAAVAGAVADAVLAAMIEGRDVPRAFVNNGGDIAFHLGPGMSLRCGVVADIANFASDRIARVMASIPIPAISTQVRDGTPARVTAAAPTRIPLGVQGGGIAPLSPTTHDLADHITYRSRETGPGPVNTHPSPDGTFVLTAEQPARGLATSGRACKGHGGRSFSFGIADSVSILARTAAQADAAATMVGNAVDLPGHRAIDRRPATEIDPVSDLGDRLITFDVGPLSDRAIEAAIDAGQAMANSLLQDGLIDGAVIALRGCLRICRPTSALLEFA